MEHQARGLASPSPHWHLLHRCMDRPPLVPHLAQQDSHVVPCHLRGWYWRAALVSGKQHSRIIDARGSSTFTQMLWAVSSVALYVPWAGGAGPWISVALWLWLGVLDAVQGVGLGMILLQTLSRLHVCATLAISQMLGSVVVIVARPTVPRQLVFPDFALWNVGDGFQHSPFTSIPFWIALVCQIVIVVGYFWYYRKEQLGMWHRVKLILAIVVSDLCWALFYSASVNVLHPNIHKSISFSSYRFTWTLSYHCFSQITPFRLFLSVVDFPHASRFYPLEFNPFSLLSLSSHYLSVP